MMSSYQSEEDIKKGLTTPRVVVSLRVTTGAKSSKAYVNTQ